MVVGSEDPEALLGEVIESHGQLPLRAYFNADNFSGSRRHYRGSHFSPKVNAGVTVITWGLRRSITASIPPDYISLSGILVIIPVNRETCTSKKRKS